MVGVSTPTSFDGLRIWEGSQHRAFEELSYQLLKDNVPSGTRAIRTGNPDGGVEWYATLSDGTEWGWQAKHVNGIDALLNAMTDSVKRVAKERPTLRRLTFAISTNLSTGTSGRERKSQRQKYEDKVSTWKRTITGADAIEFELVQESDLLDLLAKPEHKGRIWFWWGGLTLGSEWLRERHTEQSDAAGDKYRPDLQVDIPIQDDLLALGFDATAMATFDGFRRRILTAVDELHPPGKGRSKIAKLHRAISDASVKVGEVADAALVSPSDPAQTLKPLSDALTECSRAITDAWEEERRLEDAWRQLPKDEQAKKTQPSLSTRGYDVQRLSTAIDELDDWLSSSPGRAWQSHLYFLTGQAGSGKTQLFLDAVDRALSADRSAVFLAGARFGQGNFWASVTDQLGLEAVGADVLLRAMDSAAEASSLGGSRFLIFVDALNETTPPEFWGTHLPALRAAVARYPHVALAVSCRDTYRELILADSEGSHYVRRDHPGFADREVEATQRYFDHYGLEAPKIPLLTPEFSLPLFLRLFCESMALPGAAQLTGHQGRVTIFERYLAAKVGTTARRFRQGVASAYELKAVRNQISGALDVLLDEFARTGRESMAATTAESIVQAQIGGPAGDASRLVGLLQDEGVLTQERLYLGDSTFGDGVRIVFQAFSDFLLIQRRFSTAADPLHDPALIAWLKDECSWGVLEAASVYVPEKYGTELIDLLGIKLSEEPTEPQTDPAWRRRQRAVQLHRSVVETLPHRDSNAVTQRTIDLLNAAQAHLSRVDLYRVLFTLAPQKDNRLNAHGMDAYLRQRKMPQRDADFGVAVYHELSDPFGPIARLARWAAAGPYPTYDPDVVELACIPLCWLFSSSNRFMRDWVTKALVELLRGHLDVASRLVERFWTVDDPYVVQRVIAVAYGALLRRQPGSDKEACALIKLIHKLVFTPPVRPDELLLDAARGVVRLGVAEKLIPTSALVDSQRPYGLKPPGPAPSDQTLDRLYGRRENQPDDESYASIRFSLLSMGDFGRYVVGSGLDHFSRYRIGQTFPDRQDRTPRFIKARWRRFVATLSTEQQTALAEMGLPPEDVAGSLWFIRRNEFMSSLTDEQRELLKSVRVQPKYVDHDYPAASACRWLFRRTIGLGWTPKLFGEADHRIGHGRGREGHKAERWGKKYQWMAYHELLARVADNYQSARRYDDDAPYEGLHQIIGEREIDPSLPPIDFVAFNDDGGADATAWKPSQIALKAWPPRPLDFTKYKGDIRTLIADTASEPTLAELVFVQDTDGADWVVLGGAIKQIDAKTATTWRGIQQFTVTNSVFVGTSDAEGLLAALASNDRHFQDGVVDTHGHVDCCYVGEIGRSAGPQCPHRSDKLEEPRYHNGLPAVASPIETFTWEGSIFDCSIGTSAVASLPSAFIQQASKLSFDARGPSWLDASGAPVLTNYAENGVDGQAFLVRASFLQDFMATRGVDLLLTMWFERLLLDGDHTTSHPYLEARGEGRLTAELGLKSRALRRDQRNA